MQIPERYSSFLDQKGSTVLSVIGQDGTIQSSLVWSDYKNGLIGINMLNTAPKYKNILRTEKATVLKVRPENEDLYISIRCTLFQVSSKGAIEHLNMLTKRNMGLPVWYGGAVPENPEEQGNCVIVLLKPARVYFT